MFKGILHTTRGEQHCRLDVVGNTLVCTDCSIVGIEELLLNGRTTPQRLTCPPPLIVIMSLPPPPPSVAPYQPHNIQMGKVQCTLKRGTEAAVITPYVLFTFTMCRRRRLCHHHQHLSWSRSLRWHTEWCRQFRGSLAVGRCKVQCKSNAGRGRADGTAFRCKGTGRDVTYNTFREMVIGTEGGARIDS